MQRNIDYWKWDKLKPPFVESFGVGAEGIVFRGLENNPPGYERKRYWHDLETKDNLAMWGPDPFQENQWVSVERTFGQVGIIRNHSYETGQYKSLIEEDGIGILCFRDYIFIAGMWYATGDAEDKATMWYKLYLRPRKVSRNDLIYYLLGDQCNVSCRADDVNVYPCIDSQDADQSWDIKSVCPQGSGSKVVKRWDKEMTCDEWMKRPENRADYKEDTRKVKIIQEGSECLKICTTASSSVVVTGTVTVASITSPVTVQSVQQPIRVSSVTSILSPVKISGEVPVSIAGQVPVDVQKTVRLPVNVQETVQLPVNLEKSIEVPVIFEEVMPVSVSNTVATEIIQKESDCLKVCQQVSKHDLLVSIQQLCDGFHNILNAYCAEPQLPCSVRNEMIIFLHTIKVQANKVLDDEDGVKRYVTWLNSLQTFYPEYIVRKMDIMIAGIYYLLITFASLLIDIKDVVPKDLFNDPIVLDKAKMLANHLYTTSNPLMLKLDSLQATLAKEDGPKKSQDGSDSMEIDPEQSSQADSGISSSSVREDSRTSKG